MASINKPTTSTSKSNRSFSNFDKSSSSTAHVGEAASDLLRESSKRANELYEEGLDKVQDVKALAEDYSQELLNKVKENPLNAILIAFGAGVLLTALLRK